MRPAHYQKTETRELTPRQREVIELIAAGRTNGEIGEALGISLDGAKAHVRDIMTKFEASSRQEAVEKWRDESSARRRTGRWLRALVAIPGLKVGGLAAGAVIAVAAVAVTLVSIDGSDARDSDAVSEYTNVLDALDAIDGPGILQIRTDQYFGEEAVVEGVPERFGVWSAILYDERGMDSWLRASIIQDGGQAVTQVLFNGVTRYSYTGGTYQTENPDEGQSIATGFRGIELDETRAILAEAASVLQAAEMAGVVTRAPTARPGLDELRVAVGADEAAALISGEPIPGLALLESDVAYQVALSACATYLTDAGDGSFHYAFVVNSGGYGLTGARCWVEEDGEQRDVHSVYQTWIVRPADDWETLVTELAPELAAMVFE